jgi:tRNA (cytidine/uridine-2'-O-)-methyltransferase
MRLNRPANEAMGAAMPLRLALYQPDIPQNAGTMLRMAACFGVAVDIIEPAGFPVSDRHFRRAGMDYLDLCEIARHISWRTFDEARRADGRRLVLLTTKGEAAYADFRFSPFDTLMVGRESAGVPEEVRAAVDARIVIPMRPELRSLNVAVSAAIVLGEALRQTGGFPSGPQNRLP